MKVPQPDLTKLQYIQDSYTANHITAAMKEHGISFGTAVDAAELFGNRIRRKSWPEGVFIFLQVPCEVPVGIISKMSSLPQPVKDYLVSTGKPLKYCDQFALVTPDNAIRGWTPLPEDALAGDWVDMDFDISRKPQPSSKTAQEETVGTAKPIISE